MPHLSTPTSKSKDQPLLTIILALLLHVLLAIVVYFTVFDHKKTPESQALINKDQPITSKPMIAEDTHITSDQIEGDQATVAQVKVDDTAAFSAQVSADKEPTASAAPVSNNNTATQNHKPQEHTPPQKPTSSRSSQTPSTIAASSAYVSKNSDDSDAYSMTTINNRPINSEQQSTSEYQLQQTQETQQLNADIDKDSEQLSRLINEVKQRNQQQIDARHANQPIEPPIPASPADDMVTPDYPITPITSLDESANN